MTLASLVIAILCVPILLASYYLAYLNWQYPGRPKLWRRP